MMPLKHLPFCFLARTGSSSFLSFCFLLLFFSSSLSSLTTAAQIIANSLENSPISHISTTVGGTVKLPCDFTPPSHGDTSIVLFYRGENKTPIYTVDSRGSSLSEGNHWSADYLDGRGSMRLTPRDSGLVLRDARLDDEGLYRCRVDFEYSPTENSRVHLRVIEPPRRISIVSSWEEERRTSDVIGPYPEGSEVTLSCQVIGGIPPPKVTWWQEGSLLDDESEVRSGGVTRNSLHLPKLKRSDLLKVVTCQAVNSNLTTPLTKAVTIDLAYPPSQIRITSAHDDGEYTSHPATPSKEEPLLVTCVSGLKCPLECRVEGSRPPPLVTWRSSGRTLESEFQTISSPPGAKGPGTPDGDTSFHSTLMLTADASDNGALISCRATSPALPRQAIEDNVKLNVLYKPQLKLSVKGQMDLKNVEENEEVQFECSVDANPIVAEIQWTRNWIPVVENASAGVHLGGSGSTLVLKRVTRALSGHYACAAANSQGAGTSNVIQLAIKFAPKCSSKQVTSVGIGRAESANITCRVEAHPTATIFRWAFNTSEELYDIPFEHQIEKNDSSNTITYQPRNSVHFGDLLCWASNSVGTMKDPCVIKVLPIDKPEGVRSCKVSSNGTMPEGMVIVICLPGWDGGLSQTFTLEVRKAAHVHARILAALQHSSDPVFNLRNLLPGEEYLFTITSANPRGTSPPVTLTYKSPEAVIAGLTNKHSNPQSSFMKFFPFIAIFVALIIVMTTCVSIIACIAKSRAAEKAQSKKEMERKASIESRKTSIQHSLPPDRGKDEADDEGHHGSIKDPSEHYCAVHGHERAENEYISYKHYFNNMRDDMETQHLLKSSMGGSSGMDNQFNAFNNNNNNNNNHTRDSSISCGLERQQSKEPPLDYPCGRMASQRYSDGSFRGLAPLASVDSLSGYSTLSNHSSASKKTENSSQKSFRAIPETVPDEGHPAMSANGFSPRALTSTMPSIKVTSFPSVLEHDSSSESGPSSNCSNSPTYQTAPNRPYKTSHFPYHPTVSTTPYHPSPNSPYCPSSNYAAYTSPNLGIPQPTSLNSTYSTLSHSGIPSLPPPAISTHPMFLNDGYKAGGGGGGGGGGGQFCREEARTPSCEYLNQERKRVPRLVST